MPISRRYHPEIVPGESLVFGMDFSTIIPPGVGIASVGIGFQYNVNPPAGEVPPDVLTAGPVSWSDRTVYATVTAAQQAYGQDFRIAWQVTDTSGNTWQRFALVLCSYTS